MKKFKKAICLICSIAMIAGMAGCSDDETTEDTGDTTTAAADGAETTAAPERDPAPANNLEYSEPIKDGVFVTIGNYDVSYDEYRWYFLTIKKQYDQGDETFWEGTANEGTDADGNAVSYTAEEDADSKLTNLKEQALAYLQTKYKLLTLADEKGFTLSDEEKKEVDDEYAKEKADYEASENKEYDTYEEYLKTLYTTPEVRKSDMQVDKLIDKLILGLFEQRYRDEVLPEMCMAKHILLQTYQVDYEEEEVPEGATEEEAAEISEKNAATKSEAQAVLKQEKLALAEEILQKINDGEDFDKLITEYNEDPGETQNEDGSYDGYLFGTGQMVEEFEKAAFALKDDEVSEIVETDYGYHIIKRVAISEDYLSANMVDLILSNDTLYSEYSTMAQSLYDSIEIKYGENYGNVNVKSLT